MNIFVVDTDPAIAAQSLHDKHVVKMVLESAQLLCSQFDPGIAPYKRTHYNHSCSVWARQSLANYNWLLNHAYALCEEYTHRYGKEHKSLAVIRWCDSNKTLLSFPEKTQTPFALAVPEQYRSLDVVSAYKAYYSAEKLTNSAGIAQRWTKRSRPLWL